MTTKRGESGSGLKQSVYMTEDMLKELELEARRQDRSMSWLIQRAWILARAKISEFPSATTYDDDHD